MNREATRKAEERIKAVTKGKKDGTCNRTACQKPGAIYYNHSTRMYYCPKCADMINRENEADAINMFGHALCTLDESGNTKDKQFSHRGFNGTAEISIEDGCLHGLISNTSDLISYEGPTVSELKDAFELAVDDYINMLKDQGVWELRKPSEPDE